MQAGHEEGWGGEVIFNIIFLKSPINYNATIYNNAANLII